MDKDNAHTAQALFEMGKRFYLPSSGFNDPDLAFRYFSQSAEAGYAPAQRVLGRSYLEGRLTPPDYEKARHWLGLAASQHDGQAAYSLALIFAQGLGVNRDLALAHRLLCMECVHSITEARLLKEELKESLQKDYPQLLQRLAAVEERRRSGYCAHRLRFIQPWSTPSRPQLEKEEFETWLSLSHNQMDQEEAFVRLNALMDAYYQQQEARHPQTSD